MEDEERLQLGGNPDWMSRLPEKLLDVPLWNLAIPGSHDSMSFCLDVSSPVLRSEPCLLRVSDRLCPCWTRPCVSRWATTQQSVLSDQCDLGVRFLDLRIAMKPKGGLKLFFAHGIYTVMTVQEALDELATWLDAHPKEIVIISCSHFESLTNQDHARLVEFIIALFGKKLCSPQDTPTLRSCWSRGHQLVVSYSDQQMVLQHSELWPEIPYWYADSPDPKKVIAYLDDQKHRGRPEHEEDDDEGSLAAAALGERAAAGPPGERGQRPLLRLCGRQSVLLACDWLELQTAGHIRPGASSSDVTGCYQSKRAGIQLGETFCTHFLYFVYLFWNKCFHTFYKYFHIF
ncbi:PI-PLC X domain-containing protein 1-like isoform X2 [Chaetodon auriga]|uniref:PI-PLC X domain-containing protein 1-like isoform X2 n=1 Tax=Chaetodon auriga TaxID=39042 RepID=UPI004032AF9A